MLTKKQHDLLVYIHDHMQGSDIAPSFEEMKNALGLKSKSGIHRLIRGLEERGYLERLPHRARALEIKRLPESVAAAARDRVSLQSPNKDDAVNAGSAVHTHDVFEIPLCGKIAAGTPIEALSEEGPSIAVAPSLIGSGEHYALMVEGDSMINAGIHDTDIAIIQRCSSAENGVIVVALVDDQEATLKRLRRAGQKIVLEPENEEYEPQILDPERVKIQGRLVGIMRSYH